MQINSFHRNSRGVTQYLERYVNDGSPSGFTPINSTSESTDPLGLTPWMHLYLCGGPPELFETFGEIPAWPSPDGGSSWILVHPDMQQLPELGRSELSVNLFDSVRTIPTSSGRTIQFLHRTRYDYVKLHYDRILGRVNRALPRPKAIAGVEVSRIIADALVGGILEPSLCLLPEIGTRILLSPSAADKGSIGMVWRSGDLIGDRTGRIRHLVPYFSLFSVDRFAPYDPPLLWQILESSREPVALALDGILLPILRSYFSLVRRLGLQPEWNAQNLMIGLDDDLQPVGVVMRDCGEIEKDLSMRLGLCQAIQFVSAPYKCIDDSQDLYRIRHSFAYDFKLGEYIFEPLVRCLDDIGHPIANIRCALKAEARRQTADLPGDFFPVDGRWYAHERILLSGARPYVSRSDPKYR